MPGQATDKFYNANGFAYSVFFDYAVGAFRGTPFEAKQYFKNYANDNTKNPIITAFPYQHNITIKSVI